MKLSGYQVEFLPLERRLTERRFIDATPNLYAFEKRFYDRRKIEANVNERDNGQELDFQLRSKVTLNH